METAKTIAVIRHAESAYNRGREEKRDNETYRQFRGLFDAEFQDGKGQFSPLTIELAKHLQATHEITDDPSTPLAPGAEKTAELAAQGLRELMGIPQVIYSSPYKRTLDTLEAMRVGWPELKDVKVVKKDELREQEHGRVLTVPEWRVLMVIDPQVLKARSAVSEHNFRYPEGESRADVKNRAGQLLTWIAENHPHEELILVSHHVTTLGFCAVVEGWDEEEFLNRDKHNKPANASVTIFRSSLERNGNLKLDPDEYNMIFYK